VKAGPLSDRIQYKEETMVEKGKILKVRLGHEANCSSGMNALPLIFAAAVIHLPLTLIAAVLQARSPHKPITERLPWQLILPQILGLAGIVWITVGDVEDMIISGVIFGLAYLGTITIGFVRAPKMKYPWLLLLMLPLMLIVGLFVSFLFLA
jgi:hypothetical protein